MTLALDYDLVALEECIAQLGSSEESAILPAEVADTDTSGGGTTLPKVLELLQAYSTLLQEIKNLHTVTVSYLRKASENIEAADQEYAQYYQ
ncbi:MAG: hypothetical protein LBG68_03520 [Coriobacteriales bacterium]|jgi:hypothetical protein|nr:hypothetical protein [Coriobacteriales bacterium]